MLSYSILANITIKSIIGLIIAKIDHFKLLGLSFHLEFLHFSLNLTFI